MDTLEKAQTINSCPNCGGINIGKLNKYSYFCRECYVEVAITKKNQLYVHINSEDGLLIRKIRVG